MTSQTPLSDSSSSPQTSSLNTRWSPRAGSIHLPDDDGTHDLVAEDKSTSNTFFGWVRPSKSIRLPEDRPSLPFSSSTQDPSKQPEPPSPSFRISSFNPPRGRLAQRLAAVSLLIPIITLIALFCPHIFCLIFPPDQRRFIQQANVSPADPYSYSARPIRLNILTNFPDPSIIYSSTDQKWYAYGTNDAAGILQAGHPVNPATFSHSNIQIAESTDFRTWLLWGADADPLPDPGAWTLQGSAMPVFDPRSRTGFTFPTKACVDDANSTCHATDDAPVNEEKFAPRANVWAPDIIQHRRTGVWLLYYAAAADVGQHKHHCVGVATSTSPKGPFTPHAEPLACPHHDGGAIDPVVYIDDSAGKGEEELWLAYKVDGNAHGYGGECGNMVEPINGTPILLQKLDENGTAAAPGEEPITILDRKEEDGPLVEAPALIMVKPEQMVRGGGGTGGDLGGEESKKLKSDIFFLFYSSGCTRNPDYNVRYAVSSNLTGPYKRAMPDAALLSTGDFGLEAPGSVSIRWVPEDPRQASYVDEETGSWELIDRSEAVDGCAGVNAGVTQEEIDDFVNVERCDDTRAKGKSKGSWKMALHSRVNVPGVGGVRAMFSVGLEFDGETVRLVNGTEEAVRKQKDAYLEEDLRDLRESMSRAGKVVRKQAESGGGEEVEAGGLQESMSGKMMSYCDMRL